MAVPKKVWFTLVFDREANEPAWFKKLWDAHRVAIITYRKGVKDKWDEYRFQPYEILISTNKSTMQICEQGSLIQDIWFREVRKLNDNGHQTSIITTHPSIDIATIAKNMLSRWTQENYFKYAIENFDMVNRLFFFCIQSTSKKSSSFVMYLCLLTKYCGYFLNK